MNLDLNEIRQEIDKVDASLVELFEKRMELCQNVALFKIQNHKNVLDKQREIEKIQKVVELAENDFNRHGIEELFTQIMAISRKLQYRLLAENGKGNQLNFTEIEAVNKSDVTVVYQGVPGAYSHQAMLNYFGNDVKNYHVITFREAMEDIRDGKADYAVLPIENTTAGIVNDVYDLFVEFDNCIVDQTDVLVRHALLGTKDASLEDIEVVYSHPQGIMQCSQFLEKHKNWQKISQSNTAASAKKVIEENNKTHAAIASTVAAEIYGLKVLEENINYNLENTTRFIIVSRNKVYTKKAGKVLLCFELPHSSGTLYNMLSHFTYNGLNMTKIESRPLKSRPLTEKNWEYRFFVEFEGNFNEAGTLNAIRGIMEEANAVKVLGNY